MLIGEFIHILDSKKRVSLPAKFRKELGKKVVITHGLDNCLFVYTLKQWENIAMKLVNLSIGKSDTRKFNRFMLSGAVETSIDSIGRVLIPGYLKNYANLTEKVIVVGVYDRIEIWNDEVWTKYKKSTQKQADKLAEKLGKSGVI